MLHFVGFYVDSHVELPAYACVTVYACVPVYTYMHVCMHVFMNVDLPVCACVPVYACMPVGLCMNVCLWACVCMCDGHELIAVTFLYHSLCYYL